MNQKINQKLCCLAFHRQSTEICFNGLENWGGDIREIPRIGTLPKLGFMEGGFRGLIKRILVATDGSDHAKKTIEIASDIAQKYDGTSVLLHVGG